MLRNREMGGARFARQRRLIQETALGVGETDDRRGVDRGLAQRLAGSKAASEAMRESCAESVARSGGSSHDHLSNRTVQEFAAGVQIAPVAPIRDRDPAQATALERLQKPGERKPYVIQTQPIMQE